MLFALGIFVTIIQIIRIQTISSLANYLDSARAIQWSIVEANIGITITCIPPLAPLVKYFSEKTRTGTGSGSKEPESRYALRTWRLRALGSRGNHDIDITGVSQGDSTDRILGAHGIVKRTDVVVTRQSVRKADAGNPRESGESIEEELLEAPQNGSTSTNV